MWDGCLGFTRPLTAPTPLGLGALLDSNPTDVGQRRQSANGCSRDSSCVVVSDSLGQTYVEADALIFQPICDANFSAHPIDGLAHDGQTQASA